MLTLLVLSPLILALSAQSLCPNPYKLLALSADHAVYIDSGSGVGVGGVSACLRCAAKSGRRSPSVRPKNESSLLISPGSSNSSGERNTPRLSSTRLLPRHTGITWWAEEKQRKVLRNCCHSSSLYMVQLSFNCGQFHGWPPFLPP